MGVGPTKSFDLEEVEVMQTEACMIYQCQLSGGFGDTYISDSEVLP
jgi:hypothetical protein